MEKMKIYIKAILIPVILGTVVGFFISDSIDYNMLIKPMLAPPSWLFPIVWITLYTLMGISYGMLDSKNLVDEHVNKIYYLQLFVNLIWPILFFVLKWRLIAFLWIVLLIILIIKMIMKFYTKDKLAGILQIPYFLWTVFATYLNFFVYLLNK